MAKDLPFDTPIKIATATHIIKRALFLGLAVSGSLAIFTSYNLYNVLSALTKSVEVQLLASQIMPIVLLTQLVKGMLLLYMLSVTFIYLLFLFYIFLILYIIYITRMCTPHTCYHYTSICIPVTILVYTLYLSIYICHNYDSYIYKHAHIGLSYATGGILLGGKDWAWSTASMVTAAVVCIGKRIVCSVCSGLWFRSL